MTNTPKEDTFDIPKWLSDNGWLWHESRVITPDCMQELQEAIKRYSVEQRLDEISNISNMCHKNGPYTHARELTYTDFMLASRRRTAELTALLAASEGAR